VHSDLPGAAYVQKDRGLLPYIHASQRSRAILRGDVCDLVWIIEGVERL
jgi:hypothetical protein